MKGCQTIFIVLSAIKDIGQECFAGKKVDLFVKSTALNVNTS